MLPALSIKWKRKQNKTLQFPNSYKYAARSKYINSSREKRFKSQATWYHFHIWVYIANSGNRLISLHIWILIENARKKNSFQNASRWIRYGSNLNHIMYTFTFKYILHSVIKLRSIKYNVYFFSILIAEKINIRMVVCTIYEITRNMMNFLPRHFVL